MGRLLSLSGEVVSAIFWFQYFLTSVILCKVLKVYNDLTGAKLSRILTMTYKSDKNRMLCDKSEVH